VADLRRGLQDQLGSAFTVDEELPGGGMSTVFLATDHGLNRRVVVKVLPPELAQAVSLERFKREILLAAGLQHPHIVPVISAGEVDGLPWFTMPYIDGESLRSRLLRGPLSVRETVAVLRDVARALAYAHGRDVVHRDIKPDNILLTAGSAVVTDFGVAKAITASRARAREAHPVGPAAITAHGIAVGTPAYMSPEQAAGDPRTDHRSDLYSLGIVAYEMLSGAVPFHGASPQQVIASHLTRTPPPIYTRRYDVPKGLARIVADLLEKEPARRMPSAAELVRSLESPEVLSGEFATAPRQPFRKYRGALIGLGLVALGMLLGWLALGR